MNRWRCPQWVRTPQAAAIAVAGTVLFAPAVLFASSEPRAPELVVSGPRSGQSFNAPSGVALNPATGEIIVANTNDRRIEVFSGGGRLLTRLPHFVQSPDGTRIEGLPRSAVVAESGHLLVVDAYAPYVDVLDYRGRSVAKLETAVPPGAGGLSAVAITRKGTILAAAPGDHGLIYVFGPDYSPKGSWGVSGKGPGQLSSITALAELPDGKIAVTCAQTDLGVQIFTPEGTYVRGFGRHEIGAGNFSLPSGIAVTQDGRIWVSDELRQMVQVFDSEGSLLGAFGGGGNAPGQFLFPSAIASDGVDRLVVAERAGARVQVFSIRERGDGSDPETRQQ